MLDQPTSEPAAEGGIWPRLRELGGQSGIYLIADVLSKGLALFLLPLYLQYLTPADYGIIAVVVTVTVLLTIVFGLALYSSIQRIYFELDTEDERRTLYASVLGFLIVAPAVAALGVELLGRFGGLDLFRSVPYDPYLRLAVLTAYLSAFREIPLAIYAARGEARRVLSLLVFNAVLLAATSVAFIVIAEQGAIGAVRAALVTAAVVAALCVALTMREAHFKASWPLLKTSLVFGVPLMPYLVGHWVLTLADRSVLDRFVTTEEIGIYALSASIAIGAFLFASALGRAFTPALTREMTLHGGGGRVPALGTWWLAALVWVCTAIALLAGPLIVLLFDARYEAAIPIVPWLVAGYLAHGIHTIVIQGAWFSKRVRLIPVLTIAAGAINVGLAIFLVPRVGPVGAGVATMVGFVALAIMQGMLSQRHYPIAWEYGRWIKLFLAAGLVFTLGSLVGSDPDVPTVAVKVIALFIMLPVLLWVLRFFDPAEMARLRAFARIRTR